MEEWDNRKACCSVSGGNVSRIRKVNTHSSFVLFLCCLVFYNTPLVWLCPSTSCLNLSHHFTLVCIWHKLTDIICLIVLTLLILYHKLICYHENCYVPFMPLFVCMLWCSFIHLTVNINCLPTYLIQLDLYLSSYLTFITLKIVMFVKTETFQNMLYICCINYLITLLHL